MRKASSRRAPTVLCFCLAVMFGAMRNAGAAAPDSPAVDTAKLQAIPDSAVLAEADKSVKQIFRKEYLDRTPAGRIALAEKMIHQSADTTDPAAKFVLLREARDLAAAASELKAMQAALDGIAGTFNADMFEMRLAAYGAIVMTPVNGRDVTLACLGLSQNAAVAGIYEQSVKAATKAGLLATNAKDVSLVAMAQAQLAESREGQQELQKALEATKKLATDPEDAQANLMAGRFLCFRRGDWEQGLPMLAKGADADLKALAAKEAAAPTDAASQIKLAEAWWMAGEKQPGRNKSLLRRRSMHWYGLSQLEIHGLEEATFRGRLETFAAGDVRFTYLSDLQEVSVHTIRDWGWSFGKKTLGNKEKSPIVVAGVKSPNGLSTSPTDGGSAEVVYDLAGRYSTLDGAIAIDDSSGGTATPMVFKIFGDGKELWHSAPVDRPKKKEKFVVNVDGVKSVKMFVDSPGDYRGAAAVWIEPRLGR